MQIVLCGEVLPLSLS